MMVCAVSVMASTRLSTRRLTKKPPASPSTMTSANDHCAALATMPNSRRRSSRSRRPAGGSRRAAVPPAPARDDRCLPALRGGDNWSRASPADRARRAPASRHCRQALPRRRGDEIKARSRPPRAQVDDDDQAPDTALSVLLAQPGDFGIDRRRDLLGDQTARIEREIAEQRRREDDEDQQINQRQLERRGAQ